MLSIGGVALLVVGIVLQVLTFRKRRPVRPVVTLAGQIASILALVIYSTIMARPPGPIEWLGLLGIGFLFGQLYGGLVKVERVGSGVVMSYTLPWLIAWGAILATTQLLAITSGRVPVILYCAGILTAGLNVGMQTRVLAAARKLPAQEVVIVLLAVAVGAVALGASAGRAQAATPAGLDKLAPQLSQLIIENGGSLDSVDAYPIGGDGITEPANGVRFLYTVKAASSGGDEVSSAIYVDWFRNPTDAQAEYDRQADNIAKREPYGDLVSLGRSGNAVVRAVTYGEAADKGITDAIFEAVVAAAGDVDWEGALAFYSGGTAPPPADTTQPSDGTDAGTSDAGNADPAGPGSGGKGGLLGLLADFYANRPVPIGQQAGATVAAGGIFMLGSLLQLFISLGSQPSGPRGGLVPGPPGTAPVDPLTGAARSADGRVYFRAPWDDAGAGWMSEADARGVIEMERQGLHYTRSMGWVSDGQEAEYASAIARSTAADRVRDPEIVEIEQRIRDARAGAETARAGQARFARIGELWDAQRGLEQQRVVDGAEAAEWDRIAEGASQVQGIADFAVNTAGTFGGPLGRGIRAGYNYASGLAQGYGNYLAEGTADSSRLTKHLIVGHVSGLAKAGATEAIDYGATKAIGAVPGVVNYLRGVPSRAPVPGSLLSTSAALEQLTDPGRAVGSEHILTFVNNGGLQKVAQLEALGHAPAGQVQSLVKVVTAEVDDAVTQGAKQAFGEWNRTVGRESGVRVTQVLVGDAGSSAGGALRSAATDADRTFWAVHDKRDLARYAGKNGLSQAEAALQLNRSFATTADDSVQQALRLRGIDPAKVDYKTYSGFGGNAGPADTYPTGDALVRQAVGGRTTVVSPTAQGGLGAYKSSGRTLADEYMLSTGRADAAPIIATVELAPLAQRQVESIAAHTDVKSVAKAITRLAYVDGRCEVGVLGGRPMDPALKMLSQQIRSSPQEAADVLRRAGMTESQFRDKALGAASDVMKRVGALSVGER